MPEHTYTLDRNTPNDQFSNQVSAKLNGMELDQDNFENWPADKVRRFEEARLKELSLTQDGHRARLDVATFTTLHPEYIDQSANNALMNHELQRMGVPINPTVEQLETAYQSLRASGFLVLDKKELAKQEKASAQERAAAHKAKDFDEATAYTLSMSELYERGMGR